MATSGANLSWEMYIKSNIFMLKVMGLWPSGNEWYTAGFYTIYTCFVVALCLQYIIFQVINIAFIYDDLEAVVGTIYILLIGILATIKLYSALRNTKILKERVAIIQSGWFDPVNSRQRELIEPILFFWKASYRVFFLSCVFCNVFWALYPLLDKSTGGRRLPFLAWYPYDWKVTPYYEITYACQVGGCGVLTFVHFNVDTFISAFNVYTGCQCDILCDNLRYFAIEGDPYGKLIDCVHHHKDILGFVEECTKFCTWILFWHLLISGVSIGITMFQLTLVEPFSNQFYSIISYGAAILIQIFLYCWFANEVEVKSNHLSYALFESDWIDLSRETKTCILFFTMKLLKPLQIMALNIFQMSIETLMKILKTAWSYFALLYQLSSTN